MALNDIYKMYFMKFLASLQFFGAVSVPFFLDWVRVDYTRMFILEAWFMLCIFLLEVPTGIIADKYGRKISIILSLFSSTVSMLIFGISNSYAVLFIAEFVGALGIALLSGANEAFIYDSLRELKLHEKSRYFFSKYDAVGTLGLLIGFPVGSLLVGSKLIQYPDVLAFTFILTAGSSFLSFLISLTLKEPKRRKLIEKNFLRAGLNGFKHILLHKSLRAFALNSALISAVTFFMFWFYQPLAGAAGIPISYYGILAAGFNLFGVILLSNIKRLEKIFTVKQLLFFSAVLPGLLFIGIALSKQTIFVFVSIFLITGSKLLRRPILAGFMNRHIESQNRATVLSGISMFERATIFLLYPVVGLFADISLNTALLSLGVLTLVFAVITRLEAKHIR